MLVDANGVAVRTRRVLEIDHEDAFVTLRDGADTSAEGIIQYCRDNMAHFKTPKTIVFGPLAKTSTGKIQKFVLRERAKNL